jgi:hypothetical protein
VREITCISACGESMTSKGLKRNYTFLAGLFLVICCGELDVLEVIDSFLQALRDRVLRF